MITRIVKMKFRSDKVAEFRELFEQQHTRIKAFRGCQDVTLYQDINEPGIFFTYSHWESEDALQEYRSSDVFRSIWTSTKALFSERAEAWSLNEIKVSD